MSLLFQIFVLLTISVHAFADEKPTAIFIYDYRTNTMQVTTPPLKPNRVHIRFDDTLSHWVLVLSDDLGRVPPLGESLLPGTIVKGTSIGVSADAKYHLDEKGKWSPSQDPEVTRVLVNGVPPVITTVSRIPSAGSKPLEFPSLKRKESGSYLKPKTRKLKK